MISQDTVNGFDISIQIENVTPSLACQWLEEKNKKNRRRNQNHVNALAKNMKDGTWRFNGDTICFDVNDVLIDGQHRLSAIIESGISQKMIVVKGLDPDTIKTKDMEVKPRNLADLLRMDGITQANQKAAIVTRYLVLSAGRTAIYNGNNGGIAGNSIKVASTMDGKYNVYYRYQSLFDECCLYACALADRMRTLTAGELGGLYAYLFIDLNHSEDEIRGFFDRLYYNNNDVNVINLLRDKLIKDLGATNRMSGTTKQCLVAKTWNYYIKGKDVKVLSYNRINEGNVEFI